MFLFVVATLGLATGILIFADPASLAYRDQRGEPPMTAPLLQAFRELSPVRPPDWQDLDALWRFVLGSPEEGLNTSLSRMPEAPEPITLPHRTLHADTPYWYVAEVDIAVDSVLEIGADDGAQLYVDGKRVPIRGDYFFVPASPTKTPLVVRVLNKAMYGGLETVRVAPQEEFDRYQRETAQRAQLAALVRKTRLLLAPTGDQVQAVLKAVLDDSQASLLAAQKQLQELPLTLVGPYLQEAATDRMSIVWETDEPCHAELEWGEGLTLEHRIAAYNEGNLHIVELQGLEPNREYRYRVLSGKVHSPQYTFRTLLVEGPFAFTVWSDSQVNERPGGNNAVFHQNVNAMRLLPLAFTVGAGDLVENGNRREPWLRFFEMLTPLASEVPAMLLGGNHDYDGCFEDMHSVFFERYARNQPHPQYFAWTAANARFVALDPNGHFPTGIPVDSEQYRWLRRELESPEWKQATWRFLFIHQPPYSQGWPEYHGDLPIREMLDPLIEPYGIDFIVSGHTHDYERWTKTYGTQKVHLLIVGGAGGGQEDGARSAEPVMDRLIRRHHFGYFRIDGNRVTFEAIATDTRLLDHLEITK